MTKALRQSLSGKANDLSEETLHRAYRSLSMSFDPIVGGFGQAPKFPSPHNFFFLLRYWKRTGEAKALRMVEQTLQNMRHGGIYDHIGFGFHRYSTDARWIVPHFEKMLYDQALMAMAYIELYQATANPAYEQTAREIFTYVLRDLTDEQGAFYCAEDADSEGVEGKFYLWTEKEIREVLTPQEANLFLSLYQHGEDFDSAGMNEIPAGHFIAHLQPVTEAGNPIRPVDDAMEHIREKLFARRAKRIRPHRDDKILTDWNGLMVAALARGAQVFDEPVYLKAACHAMDFILESLQTADGRLLHRHRKGESAIQAHIDDYAFVIWALLDIYEATFQTKYLQKALEYHDHLCSRFLDEKNGGLFFTSSDAESLLIRPKELYDGAIPSGNSVAYINALKIARLTGKTDMENKANDIYRAFRQQADAAPTAFAHFLCSLDFAIGPSTEIIIAGHIDHQDTQAILKTLRRHFTPNKVVIFRPEKPDPSDIEALAPFVQSYSVIDGQATAYVCSNFACSLPTHDSQTMLDILNTRPKS